MKNQEGFTLMEIILAIVLIAIIAIAAFRGFEFAFRVLVHTDRYAEAIYNSQGEVENDLSILYPDEVTMTKSDVVLMLSGESTLHATVPYDSFEFQWDAASSTPYMLLNFDAEGVNVENDVVGANYMTHEIIIFVPTFTHTH